MNTILTVFKKEFIDTLRDRRTLITAIIMPAVLIPFLMYGMTFMMKTIMEKEENKKLKLAFIEAPAEFVASVDTAKIEVITGMTMESGRDAILVDSLDALMTFKGNFTQDQVDLKTTKVNMWFKSTNLMVKDRISSIVEKYEEELLDKRIQTLAISESSIDPIDLTRYDIAPKKEFIGKTAGGFLPYMFIIFCFMGCMYPALDLVTGEKERGTIETLLTVPASRFKIMLGKVMTISVMGLAAAVMGILGMYIGVKLLPDMPEDMFEVLNNIVSTKFVVMLLAMLVPLCIFFAGILAALVIKAKSFKEAQSIVSPLTFIIFLPAAMAMLPGIELDWKTACVPILNIALATKEIIAGTINTGQYACIVLSLIVLAIVAVIVSFKQFSKESMVLK